MPNSGVNN